MKRKLACVVAFTSALAAAPLFAQGTRPTDPIYFGLKIGNVDVDAPGFDDASNAGVFVGYKLWEDRTGAVFVEGEYTRSFNDGDAPGGDWDIETLAAYIGYRTSGQWFAKAKAGLGWWDVSVDGAATSAEGDDTDLTFGIGGGFRLNDRSGVEVEYTQIESDITALTVGYFTRF